MIVFRGKEAIPRGAENPPKPNSPLMAKKVTESKATRAIEKSCRRVAIKAKKRWRSQGDRHPTNWGSKLRKDATNPSLTVGRKKAL